MQVRRRTAPGPAGGQAAREVRAQAAAGRKFFRRKKVCKFCTEKIDAISYRDVRLLQGFVAERGKIVPRRLTGVCTRISVRCRRPSSSRATLRCWPLPHASNDSSSLLGPAGARADPQLAERNSEISNGSDTEGRHEKLGNRGDVVKVADGYGRNYLLPGKLAIEATAANKAVIEQMKGSALRSWQGEGRSPRSFEELEARSWSSSARWARTTTCSAQ